MARIVRNIDVGDLDMSSDEQLWIYNGLDCCVTQSVYEAINPQCRGAARRAYDFERAMLGPAISMVLRGLRIDEEVVEKLREKLIEDLNKLEGLLAEYAHAIWDKELNPASPIQLKDFLYNQLCIPAITAREKGKIKVTTNRDALERLAEEYLRAQPIALCLLKMRDIKKDLDVLKYVRDPDGRLRCSYNGAGTKTWRWSSSGSPFYSGGNLQNITKDLRNMFVADPGYTLFYADLSNAEGRTVGYLAGDDNYIAAAESGDMHTMTCRLVWAELPWTGDPEKDREIADGKYLQHTYRDVAKRAGHGTNYLLTAHSLARHTKTKLRDATKFQLKYYGGEIALTTLMRWEQQAKTGEFQKLIHDGQVVGKPPEAGVKDMRLVKVGGAYPNIRKWHARKERELQTTGTLTTPFGFTRQFWGRLTDSNTLREAIAHEPQSTIGCLLNAGAWNVWYNLDRTGVGVQILAQVHDAILGQVPTNLVDSLMPRVVECMTLPLEINGRTMIVPVDVEIGDNWKDMRKWET
jgi:DNA polymerase I-like protein with 3'-5' exonuclease and polymerase domains